MAAWSWRAVWIFVLPVSATAKLCPDGRPDLLTDLLNLSLADLLAMPADSHIDSRLRRCLGGITCLELTFVPHEAANLLTKGHIINLVGNLV